MAALLLFEPVLEATQCWNRVRYESADVRPVWLSALTASFLLVSLLPRSCPRAVRVLRSVPHQAVLPNRDRKRGRAGGPPHWWGVSRSEGNESGLSK